MVSLGNSTLEGKFILAMVRNSLFNEEIRRKNFVGNDTHALVTENMGRSKSREPFGHNKSRRRSKSRGKIKCYHYCNDSVIRPPLQCIMALAVAKNG